MMTPDRDCACASLLLLLLGPHGQRRGGGDHGAGGGAAGGGGARDGADSARVGDTWLFRCRVLYLEISICIYTPPYAA